MTHRPFARSFRTSASKAKANKCSQPEMGAGGMLGRKAARLPVPAGAGAMFGRSAPQHQGRPAPAAQPRRGAGALDCGCDAAYVQQTNRHSCGSGVCDNQTLVPLPTTQDGDGIAANASVTVTATVTTSGFSPAYMAVADSLAPNWNITAITGPAGQNLLLGGGAMFAEFFSSKDQRGGQVASCCVPAALSISVTAENISGDTAESNFQAVFWGTCGPCL